MVKFSNTREVMLEKPFVLMFEEGTHKINHKTQYKSWKIDQYGYMVFVPKTSQLKMIQKNPHGNYLCRKNRILTRKDKHDIIEVEVLAEIPTPETVIRNQRMYSLKRGSPVYIGTDLSGSCELRFNLQDNEIPPHQLAAGNIPLLARSIRKILDKPKLICILDCVVDRDTLSEKTARKQTRKDNLVVSTK